MDPDRTGNGERASSGPSSQRGPTARWVPPSLCDGTFSSGLGIPELAARYTAGRQALQRAIVALERRGERIAQLEELLRSKDHELEQLRCRAAQTTRRVEEAEQRWSRLFDAFCGSLPGRLLEGRFHVLQRIGSGGYGVVYHAVDRRLHRDVALKLLRMPEASWPPVGPHLQHLAHPNIAAVLEVGKVTEGIPFVTMELLRGKNLAEALATRREILSVEQAARIAYCVSLGLAEAHRWDVVHRDVKPSNVFLARRPDGVLVKILDFGLARVVKSPELEAGNIAGTPAYVAPERLCREPYDWHVDVYAVGVLLYELLGWGPRHWAVGHADPLPLKELRPDVPRALSELAQRALRRKPAERPAAEELARGLARYVGPPDQLIELLARRNTRPTAVEDRTLESIDRQSRGDAVGPPLPEISALTTTEAATSPNVPVTKEAVPSMRARRSQSWRPFLPPGQTQRKPTPSS